VAYNDHFPNSAAVSAGRPAIADALLNPKFIYDLATRHARRIGSTAVVLFIVFASLILLMTPHYSGTAIVLVDPRQQRVLQSDAVLSGIGNDMAAVDSQVEVIQSAPIALKVISELKLDQDPEFLPANGILELLRSIVGDRSESRMQYVLSRFASNLKVRRRGVTYILEIEFLSRSPEKAARIANAIANAYVDQQAAAKSSATSDASKWLGDRLADLRKQARDAEAAVALYKAEKGLVNTGEKRSVVEQQLADTNQQLTLARLRVEETRARLKQIEKASSNPAAKNSLVDALSSPVIAALRAQYTLAAKNSAELAQSLGPLHPAIRTSEAELSAISRQIDMEIGRLSLGVRQEFETAQERERSLEASLGKLKTAMASNDQSTVRLHELERESEAAQAILQRSLARYKETKEQEGVQAVEVRVISPAAVPLAPTGPNRKLLLAIAAMASVLLALAITVVIDGAGPILGGSRRSVNKEDVAGLPVLGYLPDVSVRDKATAASWASRIEADADDVAPSRRSPGLSASPFVEAVRRLASDFTLVHPERPYILAIAGASAGCGASAVASALADSLAQMRNAVLLVDATMRTVRHGEARQRFGLHQAIQASLSIDFAISKGGRGSADILHCGFASPTDFADVLDSDVIGAIVNKLRMKYGVIVVDTGAPVTAVQGQRFIALADSALLVVPADGPSVAGSREFRNAVELCYDKLDGAILNKVDPDAYRDHARYSTDPAGLSANLSGRAAAG
jgi:uncharacterized protein involved in exopolysaccharide biosynthesis/Mrp family chromosome partitioning ATPase